MYKTTDFSFEAGSSFILTTLFQKTEKMAYKLRPLYKNILIDDGSARKVRKFYYSVGFMNR